MGNLSPGTDEKAKASRVIIAASSNYTDGADGTVTTTVKYDASNNPTQLIKVFNTASYSRTIVYDASNNPTDIGAWTQL